MPMGIDSFRSDKPDRPRQRERKREKRERKREKTRRPGWSSGKEEIVDRGVGWLDGWIDSLPVACWLIKAAGWALPALCLPATIL